MQKNIYAMLILFQINWNVFSQTTDLLLNHNSRFSIGVEFAVANSAFYPTTPNTSITTQFGITTYYKINSTIGIKSGIRKFTRVNFPFQSENAHESFDCLGLPFLVFFKHNSTIYIGGGVGIEYMYKVKRLNLDYEKFTPPKLNFNGELFAGIRGKINDTSTLYLELFINKTFKKTDSREGNIFERGFTNTGVTIGYILHLRKKQYEN